MFTTREIAALRGSSVSTTSQALKRMERDGLVFSPSRGIWCVPNDPRFSRLALVPFLAGGHRAYVSFFSALNLHGLISQIPLVVYVATTGHTRLKRTDLGTFSFHRIEPGFFAGYDWYGQRRDFLIAGLEKALVDCFYLSSRKGNRFGHLPEIESPGDIDPKRVLDWISRIGDPRIRKHSLDRWESLRSGFD